MPDLREFEELEKDICAFANKMHSKGHEVHYKGPFITGNLENPEILFLSINPGGGEEKEVNCGNFEIEPLKYLEENENKEKLATRLFEIFGKEVLENSCETYMESFFATKNVAVLNELLKSFDEESRKEHDKLCKKMLELALKTNPKNIVFIGVKNLDYFCHGKDVKFEEERRDSNNDNKRYLLSGLYEHTPIYGTIHLSSSRTEKTTTAKLGELKDFFAEKIPKH